MKISFAAVVIAQLIACSGGHRAVPKDPALTDGKTCSSPADCAAGQRCDPCGSSSCPTCDDCVAVCAEVVVAPTGN